MMEITILGIDLGKNSCSIIGLDAAGAVVLRRGMRREGVIKLTGMLKRCVVAMKACCGAHHLCRVLRAQGHEVRLMSPEYVRPYVKSQKNDRDAEAIAEAATRPTIRFVELKSGEQLDMQTLHRGRDRLVGIAFICGTVAPFSAHLVAAIFRSPWADLLMPAARAASLKTFPKDSFVNGRTLARARSIGGWHTAVPARRFAKLLSDKNRAQHPGSSFGADSLQQLCGPLVAAQHVMFARSSEVRTRELRRLCSLFADRTQEGGKPRQVSVGTW